MIGVLLTLVVGLAGRSGKESSLVLLSYDLPVALHVTDVPKEAVIVYLDDPSHTILGQLGDKPWDRRLHAQLLRRLKAEQASLVVFDVVFKETEKTDADVEFAQAIRESGNVILAGENSETPMPGLMKFARTGSKPYEVFAKEARAYGMSDLDPNYDWGIRRFHTVFVTKPSLPIVAVTEWRSNQFNLAGPEERWVHYYGKPDSIEHCSYFQVISNYTRPEFFKDKVVFVGARQSSGFTKAMKDEYATAYTLTTGEHAAGVEIQATEFLNLLHNHWLTRSPDWLEYALITLVALVFGFGLLFLSAVPACAVVGFAAGLVVGPAHFIVWHGHVWFPWAVLLVQIGVALGWSVVFNSFRAYLENRDLERALAFHLPPARVKQILKKPELLQPSAEKQEVSLLFTDIADFSTVSDRMLPERLFKLLNKYFAETIPCIHKTEGTVVQLVGDAIFGIWNAPEPQKDHNERACRAALLLRDKLVSFESANENLPLKTRVGLHAGLATVGNCGSADRFTYTALGAETNMASRLEGLNKYLGTEVLASAAVLAPVEDKFVFRPVGHFRLKGSDRVLEVTELLGPVEEREKSKPWRDAFAEALRDFKHHEFAEAEAAFKRVLEIKPKDGPSVFYLEVLEHFRKEPPPKSWLGEIDMARLGK
jgi:adenylate cyclase